MKLRGELVLLLLWQLVAYVACAATVSHTLMETGPSKLVYFDDSTVILYHDGAARNVWRSTDEGKTWAVIDTIPSGDSWAVIEHPYDVGVAFILSKGTKHYRTLNRGQSWQSFDTPLPPGLGGVNSLAFHSVKWDWIIFTGQNCESDASWRGKVCYEEAFYTLDAFASTPKKLLDHTSRCVWAHSTKQFNPSVANELIFCIAFESPNAESSHPANSKLDTIKEWLAGSRSLRESRLYSSTDFFTNNREFVSLGLSTKEARGIVGIGSTQSYLVVALKPTTESDQSDEMLLYVSTNGKDWKRGIFPHGSGLKENAYTIVDSTPYSILVDVLTDPESNSGTLFTSDSSGTKFVKSLEHTNRNAAGIVDFEKLENVEGVAVANVLVNWDDFSGGVKSERVVQSRITFDDGGKWQSIQAPAKDWQGKDVKCDTTDSVLCTLHLHGVTQPHNLGRVFSSTAPGFVMGVGNIGDRLLPYEDCDTFLSTDAGLTWRMVDEGANKYEFGDQGSILVLMDDEQASNILHYSLDFGQTWKDLDLEVNVRATLLTTIPDSTSQKFLLIGTLPKGQQSANGERHIMVYIDFATMNIRKCAEGDFEKWYARAPGGEADCLMGHKDYFRRRKADANCVVAEKFKDPVGREENCICTDEDYECDYNFVRDGNECVLAGPQQIPAGQCKNPGDTFLGSSGYRKVPGNTCIAQGKAKDALKQNDCSQGVAAPGQVSHQRFEFPSLVVDQAYFGEDSKSILAFCADNTAWVSLNEGFSWQQVRKGATFLGMTMHPYFRKRAYLVVANLVGGKRTIWWTPDAGVTWKSFSTPADANGLGLDMLDFHPRRESWLIFTGSRDCSSSVSDSCRAVAFYTRDDGYSWQEFESYVRTCSWARDSAFKIDERAIMCESYKTKQGSQRSFDNNPLELVYGGDLYADRKTIYKSIIGFATFAEYMVVARIDEKTGTLALMVSLDGIHFAPARFPPDMHLENQAYTVLESVTDSIFLHVTTHQKTGAEWGSLFKSNSNGTDFTLSLQYANRNDRGFVDFEKMSGLDGIAVMNVVSNVDEAGITGVKKLQTRISHNDGGRWRALPPPPRDSLGNAYQCGNTACSLHLHGYTERVDPRATYSSPTAVGLMMAVGNVGVTLAPYADSDTFLTRDGGFTWQEVHKDAHLWEFGDQGTILVLANDEAPTDRVSYSLDQGLTWQDYVFGESIRVRSIVTVPQDTSRKFILLGYAPTRQEVSIAIHLDFSKVTNTKCILNTANPSADDFEQWSPSEQRAETCLFGRQTLYHRRIRDRNCFIGEQLPQPFKTVRTCACTDDDFECEFNHVRNERGECVLVPGATPLASNTTCSWGQDYWYERTAYRKVPMSSCEGGKRPDRGPAHACPALGSHGFFWWTSVIIAPCGLAALVAFWYARRRGSARAGRIRLPEPADFEGDDMKSNVLGIVASIPYYVVGVMQNLFAWVSDRMPFQSRRGRGYRSLERGMYDQDASLLADEDYENQVH